MDRAHLRAGYGKLAALVLAIGIAWLSLRDRLLSPYWLLAPVAIFVLLAVLHEQVLGARAGAERAVAFYRHGLARLEDRWAGVAGGDAGERLRDPKHVYAEDLDLFGRGSLFELLSTARTPMGENRLADWLCSGSATGDILERQGLVAELRPKLDLREELALAGEALRARLDPAGLVAWAETPPELPLPFLRAVTGLLAIAAAGAALYALWSFVAWPLVVVLGLEIPFRLVLKQRALAAVTALESSAEGLELFSALMKRLEAESFASPRLRRLADDLRREIRPASRSLRQLARIAYWIEARDSFMIRPFDLPLLYTLQVGYAADNWRRRWGRRMRSWIDFLGEVEALVSLAAYSFEHPEDPFPEFVSEGGQTPLFHGEELGHPLIPASRSVRNSILLGRESSVLLVSGSNMSGKSTLLRTVGINTVLAMAGAPARAKRLRLVPLALGTRIRTTDSLQESRSGFYTEILRIRQVFDLAAGNAPLLFLFDELLEGTNSKDRRIGAEGLLRALIARGAAGIVTTHDLALTEIVGAVGPAISNWHFQDYVENGRMRFDYKLREGVVARSNALELMRLIGLQV
ncbi:MAG TPA: hypothetical protein VGS20_02575 [Candidatus Acidoferrales bacterium]|nr:hypothetical protein [Candidatus Acidoferrales bacterium]